MKFYYTCPPNTDLNFGYYEIESLTRDSAIELIHEIINKDCDIKNNDVGLFLYNEKEWNTCVKKYYENVPYKKIKQNIKPRLFIDMDGTLAEWRNIKLDITEYENVSEVQNKIYDILYMPGYFKSLTPNFNVINGIKELIRANKIDIFVLSCVLPNSKESSPLQDKNDWLDRYLPEIDKDHRIFVPDGVNKCFYVPNGITKSDYLLDDYTKNLKEWITYGSGIKLLNGCNSNKGTWLGSKISIDCSSDLFARKILNHIEHGVYLEDNPPNLYNKPLTRTDIKKIIENNDKEEVENEEREI